MKYYIDNYSGTVLTVRFADASSLTIISGGQFTLLQPNNNSLSFQGSVTTGSLGSATFNIPFTVFGAARSTWIATPTGITERQVAEFDNNYVAYYGMLFGLMLAFLVLFARMKWVRSISTFGLDKH